MKFRLRRSLLGLCLGFCFATSIHAGKRDDTLNVAFNDGVTTLDSYRESGREGNILARLIYDNLLSKDFKTNSFKPELATSYKFVNEKTIDFEIRRGVKFHDGTLLTAEDVAYTLNLVSSSGYNARYQTAVEWIEKVDKTGDYAVRIHMKRPFAPALEMLAGNLPIYPKAYYARVGSEGMAIKPIGTGPYKATDVVQGTKYSFERFDDYFADAPKGKANIRNLVVRILPEVNTQYAELANGQLDWIWRLPADTAKRMETMPRIQVQSQQILRFEFIAINPGFAEGKGPLADARVRRALALAINREPIRRAFYGGASVLLNAACNPAQFGCAPEVKPYAYDPRAAKALLATAGYPNGVELEALSVLPNAAANSAIAASLKESGFHVKVTAVPYGTGATSWRANKTALWFSNWGSYGIGDVALSTSLFFSGTADDLYKDPKIMPLLKAADGETNAQARKTAYRQALESIAEQVYWVPLWSHSLNTAQTQDLDLQVTPDEYVPFYAARWK